MKVFKQGKLIATGKFNRNEVDKILSRGYLIEIESSDTKGETTNKNERINS